VRRLLVRLYPASWRARYGEEFTFLLEARPFGPFDLLDVVLAALDAHLHLRGRDVARGPSRGIRMSLRIGGVGAMAGGLLWFVSLAGASASADLGTELWFWLMVLAEIALLLALSGLSAFQARSHPVLTWAAFTVPAVGCATSVVGIVGMLVIGDRPFVGDMTPWSVWMIGTISLIAGSGLFAFVTLRTRTFGRPGAALLGVGSIAVVPFLSGLIGAIVPEALGQALLVASLLAFAGGWMATGWSALRLDRSVSVLGPGSAI
jgi:hypothetical protein